ncbi:hypothetical protein ACWEUB_12840 [Staphylococcus xylosus]
MSNKEIDNLLSRKDFISPFNHNTDIRGFIQDIKKYLLLNLIDPKGEAENYMKSIIVKNGIDNPDVFLKKYIYSDIVYKGENHCK